MELHTDGQAPCGYLGSNADQAVRPINGFDADDGACRFCVCVRFAFHLLMANYRQNEIIRTHNTILEQYLSQVERVTLEERERVSKERMIRWAIRIRRSLWAWKRAFHGNQCGSQRKLSNLLELTRRSLDEVRGYLHELDSPQEQLPWCSH